MKLNEVIDFRTDAILLENLDEVASTGEVSKPLKEKLNKKERYLQQYEQAMAKYMAQLDEAGFSGAEARRIAERKARGLNPANFRSKFAKQVSEMIQEIQDKGFRGLSVHVVTILVIIFINSMMMHLFVNALGLDPMVGFMTAAVFVAPVTEEVSRYIHVKKRDGARFNVMFNIAEFSLYMVQAAAFDVSLGIMALARTAAVIAHTIFTVVMRERVTSGKASALPVAMGLHALWNSSFLPGMLAAPIVALKRDRSDETETARMIVFFHDEEKSTRHITEEIAARVSTVVYVHEDVDPSFVRRHASLVGATVETFSDPIQVKRVGEMGNPVAVILPSYAKEWGVYRWIYDDIYIEVNRE